MDTMYDNGMQGGAENEYQHDDQGDKNTYNTGGNGGYISNAIEIYSHRFRGRRRTFFVDLKESENGKFVKISEKSKGIKRTVLFDIEDFVELMKALKEIETKI